MRRSSVGIPGLQAGEDVKPKQAHCLFDLRVLAIAGFALITVFTVQNYWAQKQLSNLISAQRTDIVHNAGTAVSSVLFERSLRLVNSTEMLAATDAVTSSMSSPSTQASVRLSDILSRFIVNVNAKGVCFFGTNGAQLFPCDIPDAKLLAAKSALQKTPKFSTICNQTECEHYIAVPTLHAGKDVGVVVAAYGMEEVFQSLEKTSGTKTSIRLCSGIKEKESADGLLEVEFNDTITGLPEGYGLPDGFCYHSRFDIRKERATIKDLSRQQIITAVSGIAILGTVLLLLYISDRRIYYRKLNDESQARHRKSETLDRASRNFEIERKMLATELHDELGQRLVPIRFNVSILRSLIEKHNLPELEAISKSIEKDIENMSRGVSALVNSLRPPLLDTMGLRGSIEAIVDEYQVVMPECRIRFIVDKTADLEQLDDASQVALYRAVQESLTNISKHAQGASLVRISISIGDKGVKLKVSDNGPGFKVDEDSFGGMGLRGMKERAFAMNGKCSIYSEPNKGTSIQFELPVKR